MRSTIFFISMLLFVSCSKDLFSNDKSSEEIDTGLLEITKDPASEAVFATMAIQLNAKGGFQKVLGLLNELVHDSKEQLHQLTKTWRGVNARCQVSKVKLAGRQEFFSSNLNQAQRRRANAQARLAEVQDHIRAFTRSRAAYSALLKREITRHRAASSLIYRKIKATSAGIHSLGSCVKAVTHWSPKSHALVQTHMTTVRSSYLSMKEFELPSIVNMLQRTDDVKVRGRLLEWMNQVRVQMTASRQNSQSQVAALTQFSAKLEHALAGMVGHLSHALTHLAKAIVLARHTIKASAGAIRLYGKLVVDNKKLLISNKAYCQNERINFTKGSSAARAAIRLFKEVRNYFSTHYAQVHSYIKAKFHM